MTETKPKSDRNVWAFFLLTFLFAWILWLPFVLWGFEVIELSEAAASLMTPAVALGAFGPLIAALILIIRKKQKGAVKTFFKKAFDFKVKPIYYVLALLLPLITTAVAHYATNLSGLDTLPANLFPESIGIPIAVLVIPYFIFILIAGGGQEEFGWRGYAQDPLQEKYGILTASLIIGVVWGLWHLPLWFMPGEGHTFYPFIAFFLYAVSTSVTIGWLYNAGGKKLIIPLLIHTMGNVSVPFFPILHLENLPQPGYWVWVAVNMTMAICLTLVYMKKLPIQKIQ